jgi:hypothetical protein
VVTCVAAVYIPAATWTEVPGNQPPGVLLCEFDKGGDADGSTGSFIYVVLP